MAHQITLHFSKGTVSAHGKKKNDFDIRARVSNVLPLVNRAWTSKVTIKIGISSAFEV